ncbi:CH033 protein, partial [Crotophaga sulcirostris]|nr:CH033 protein [Crotophaga sulcirostris]
ENVESVSKGDGSLVGVKIPQPETAPGGETATRKPAADGAAQKKKKKKKQKTSVSKKETEETESNRKAKAEANRSQNKDAFHQDETSQADDQLQREVDWCVEQLELGLKTQKPTPKQAQEALRAIKTLRSEKAPLVKKRQVMRAVFGDYRKKMEEERCKELKLMEAAAKSARIVEVSGNTCNKSCRFFRKRSEAPRRSQDSAGSTPESPRTLNTGLFKFTDSQEEFRFNFF